MCPALNYEQYLSAKATVINRLLILEGASRVEKTYSP